jgi:HJR/Mrr/RecB family endonuclease
MEDTQKKVGFRSAFRDFVLQDTSTDIANLKNKQISYELIKYYITEIHNRISSFISPEDFDYSVTDGKDDLGVDLIYQDDGLVTIVQAKYLSAEMPPRSRTSSISNQYLSDFATKSSLKTQSSQSAFRTSTSTKIYSP